MVKASFDSRISSRGFGTIIICGRLLRANHSRLGRMVCAGSDIGELFGAQRAFTLKP